jgi:hypothetical protein
MYNLKIVTEGRGMDLEGFAGLRSDFLQKLALIYKKRGGDIIADVQLFNSNGLESNQFANQLAVVMRDWAEQVSTHPVTTMRCVFTVHESGTQKLEDNLLWHNPEKLGERSLEITRMTPEFLLSPVDNAANFNYGLWLENNCDQVPIWWRNFGLVFPGTAWGTEQDLSLRQSNMMSARWWENENKWITSIETFDVNLISLGEYYQAVVIK